MGGRGAESVGFFKNGTEIARRAQVSIRQEVICGGQYTQQCLRQEKMAKK